MKPASETTDLIPRYLAVVAARLPRAGRDDIIQELRTLIEDKLNERARGQLPAPDADAVVAVLRDLGEPGVVAARYHTRPQVLVGPRTYPTLLQLMKIGLAVAVFVVVLTTALSQAAAGDGVAGFGWTVLADMAGRVIQISITFFGAAVIALAAFERFHPEASDAQNGWDPRHLPPLPEVEEERINAPWLALEIALVIVIVVIANFFPRWVGVFVVRDGGPSEIVPLTDMGVHLPMVAINVWLAVALAQKFLILGQQRWTPLTRWLAVAVGLLATLVVGLIAAGTHLRAPTSLAQLDPVLRTLQALLCLAPVAVFVQPVLRVIRLLRGSRAGGPAATA